MFWQIREYSFPLLCALLLHALAVGALYRGWEPDRDPVDVFKPKIINAKMIVLEPKAQPRPPPKAQPRQAEPQPVKPVEQASKPVEIPKVATPPVEQPDLEAERRQREEAERQRRLQALASTSFLDAVDEESAELVEDTALRDEEVAQSYRYGIYQLVVANWSRPPSARNGMQAELIVELVPTGDVVAVTLMEGSGSAAFDRSAEAAVRKARRFEVPRESAIFERYFRKFSLLFKPEDLLR